MDGVIHEWDAIVALHLVYGDRENTTCKFALFHFFLNQSITALRPKRRSTGLAFQDFHSPQDYYAERLEFPHLQIWVDQSSNYL